MYERVGTMFFNVTTPNPEVELIFATTLCTVNTSLASSFPSAFASPVIAVALNFLFDWITALLCCKMRLLEGIAAPPLIDTYASPATTGVGLVMACLETVVSTDTEAPM